MKRIPWKKLLVLAPHTDDAELGCGGTIARLLEEKVEIHVVAFSIAEKSVPEGQPSTMIQDEFFNAMEVIGVSFDHVHTYRYPTRCFSNHRQEILEDLIVLRKQIEPDWVFVPASSDCHQDHEVIHREGVRAFKQRTVWGYELPWNHLDFTSCCFIELQKHHLEKKYSSLQSYKSQFDLKRSYFSEDFVNGLAVIRGTQIAKPFAECFECIRVQL